MCLRSGDQLDESANAGCEREILSVIVRNRKKSSISLDYACPVRGCIQTPVEHDVSRVDISSVLGRNAHRYSLYQIVKTSLNFSAGFDFICLQMKIHYWLCVYKDDLHFFWRSVSGS